jgi:hypothetical protein
MLTAYALKFGGFMSAVTKLPVPLAMDALRAFGDKWGIAELALFGSVLTDRFRPDSDVDVLVTFTEPDAIPDRALMRRELEAMFSRPVHVVYRRVIETSANPLLQRSILEHCQVIYVARPGIPA